MTENNDSATRNPVNNEAVKLLCAGEKEAKRSAQRHRSNCPHNLCNCNSHKVAWQIFNMAFGTHRDRAGLKGGSRVGYQKWHSWWLFYNPNLALPAGRSQPPDIYRDEHHTSVSMRAGLMPKKGLIAIPGTISASGSDGLGVMQMPPVSDNTEQNKADCKVAAILYFCFCQQIL